MEGKSPPAPGHLDSVSKRVFQCCASCGRAEGALRPWQRRRTSASCKRTSNAAHASKLLCLHPLAGPVFGPRARERKHISWLGTCQRVPETTHAHIPVVHASCLRFPAAHPQCSLTPPLSKQILLPHPLFLEEKLHKGSRHGAEHKPHRPILLPPGRARVRHPLPAAAAAAHKAE